MPRKRHTPEEIIAKLRQVDVLASQGTPVAEAIRQIGVTEVTYYRWRREGLKVPHKQPKRGRLWLSDGSGLRLRAQGPNHVWSYDFIEDRTHENRKLAHAQHPG
jgi:transposase